MLESLFLDPTPQMCSAIMAQDLPGEPSLQKFEIAGMHLICQLVVFSEETRRGIGMAAKLGVRRKFPLP